MWAREGASCCTCHCFRILDTLSLMYIASGDMQMLLLLLLLFCQSQYTDQLFNCLTSAWTWGNFSGWLRSIEVETVVCVCVWLCVCGSDRGIFCTVSPYCMLHKEHVSHMVGLRRTGSRFITERNPLQPFHQPLCIQRLHFKDLVRRSRVLLVTRQASTCKVHSAIIR